MRRGISELPSVDALFAAVPHAMAVRAALELGIFSSIGDSTRSADELGARLQVNPDRLSRLLFALASIGFLTIVGEGFRNSALGSAFHDASKPGYRGDEHSLLRELWSADLMTAESLRTRQPAALRDFSDGADALQFSRTLAPGGLAFGRLLGQLVDFSDVGSVIDIGGGAGTTLIGLREKWPKLAMTLMELPTVSVAARAILSDYGQHGITIEAGNIVEATSTHRHDFAILKAVVQVLPEAEARQSVINAARCLRPGGE